MRTSQRGLLDKNFICILLIKINEHCVMSGTNTPVSSSVSKKRGLSSPEESSDLKNNKLESETESREEDTNISDLSIMAEHEVMESVTEGGATGGGHSVSSHITLAENDIKTIAEVLSATFETRLNTMIPKIVDGVLEGLTSTVNSLQSTVEDLQKDNKIKIRNEIL